MNTFKRKKRALKDRKNPLLYAFWSMVNKISITMRFKDFQVFGRENIPKSGPFILVSNHITRWDGLIVYESIGRPANFMVSPNELLGVQGEVLQSMGSFPADPRADLINHSLQLFNKGEAVVVFPEGNIFRDGSTHPFKTGVAKIAAAALQAGIDLPILAAALHYKDNGQIACMAVAEPIYASQYLSTEKPEQESNTRNLKLLCERLHREVCFLRDGLGNSGDRLELFLGKPKKPALEMLLAAGAAEAGKAESTLALTIVAQEKRLQGSSLPERKVS
ncbi:MAG: 1-acyl-sn-glycerol-3-phosphate acyltransferase [Candidatus Obscuribacterales bacterium]|nr:1-acyl-sn-glycerol-3-phosphate acyltransferase [Candidatus Obscuribacterales bacterium]